MANAIDYIALTQKLTEQLNAMRAEVPFLNDPSPKADLRRLSNAARVSDEFVEQLSGVLTNPSTFTGSMGVDIPKMVDQRRAAAAFALLEAQARAFADSLHVAMTVIRHQSGTSALVAYKAVQTLQRLPGGQDLASHVSNLRRILGRGSAKRRTTVPAPAPRPSIGTTAASSARLRRLVSTRRSAAPSTSSSRSAHSCRTSSAPRRRLGPRLSPAPASRSAPSHSRMIRRWPARFSASHQ